MVSHVCPMGHVPFTVLDSERSFFNACPDCNDVGVRVRGVASAVTCRKPKRYHFHTPVAALVSRAMHDMEYGLVLDAPPVGATLICLADDHLPSWRDAVSSGDLVYAGLVSIGDVAFAAVSPP